MSEDDRDGFPRLPPVQPTGGGSSAITPEVLAGFLVDGDQELVRWALSLAFGAQTRAEVYDTLVRDAMRLVGKRWTAGRWTISEEHLASRTLVKVLASLAPPESPAERVAPLALLAGVAGEEHSLGLVMLDHVLREVGLGTADLGPNVPADDLVHYAAKAQANVVAITAAGQAREETVRDTIAALKAMPSAPVVMLGGRIADVADVVGLRDAGADWVGSSLRDAAAFARRLMPSLEPRRPGA
jgi:MerR family transcriptional regulator, light-induced transcriptional regulator